MSYDVQVEELGANRRGLVTSEEGRAIVEFMKTSRANMCLSTMMRLKLKEELLQ